MNEIIFQSTSELAQSIRDKQITSQETVEAYIQQIEQVNSALNAVVQFVADQAIDIAKVADRELMRGKVRGKLHGVPMTIKDSIDTSGVISTGGTEGRRNFIPQVDATVVKRLKEAGAILLGKTNTPELTLAFETDNLIYGVSNNPYDVSRTPGGSSGGAAAIVAAGGSPFDIGSDYGGSIRLPSHFCGVVGLKPTTGRVPTTGTIMPFGTGVTDPYQQLGPIARTVDDLNLLLPIMAGEDGQDPNVVPMPLPDYSSVSLNMLRVAFYMDDGHVTPQHDIVATVQSVVNELENQVSSVQEHRPVALELVSDLFWPLVQSDGATFKGIIDQYGTEQLTPRMSWLTKLEDGKQSELRYLIRKWTMYRSQMQAFMQEYDVIICPVNAYTAFLHGATGHSLSYNYTRAYNLAGFPAAVVRAGTSDTGLPIGIQIVGAPWREDVVLAVAKFVETVFGGWRAPDMTRLSSSIH